MKVGEGQRGREAVHDPRSGRITTAVLMDDTHWDEVVTKLGLGAPTRHDLRHTGLNMDSGRGVPVHQARKIAGHGSLRGATLGSGAVSRTDLQRRITPQPVPRRVDRSSGMCEARSTWVLKLRTV